VVLVFGFFVGTDAIAKGTPDLNDNKSKTSALAELFDCGLECGSVEVAFNNQSARFEVRCNEVAKAVL
jgi:hypothetical protein